MKNQNTKTINKKHFPTKNSKHKGFTLIETLVAIFILVISITGPMSVAQSSLKASFLARDQIVAHYLAQDAIEFIKNYRDEAMLAGNDWRERADLTACFANPNKKCNVNTIPSNHAFVNCSASGTNPCSELKIDGDYFSAGNSGTDSKFTRNIYFSKPSNDSDETQIVVTVSWNTNLFLTGTRQIVVQENIFNWLPIIN